jgi:hypothetical protein
MRGDFKEFFDPRRFTEQQLGNMEFVLNSPAYEEQFKPYIEGVLNTLNTIWKDRSRERQDKYPDEFLAGGATFGEGLLKFFEQIIRETNMERVHSSMANMTNDMLYEVRRQRGDMKPVVGLDQSAEPAPYDPAEDF